jgi:16S rRNA (cytidine1402-2'-O)-methyltransferase
MAPRAVAALQSLDVLACEDTRRTGQLFKLLGLKAPKLIASHAHNESAAATKLVAAALAGQRVGVVSDSGLPGISDPGAVAVAALRAAGVPVQVIPGPSAASLAVAGSGFVGGFLFYGFLPRKGSERATALARLGASPETVVLYEAPLRVADTVAELLKTWGNRPAYVARELTKLHEEWLGPDLLTLHTTLGTRAPLKGECVLVVGGAPAAAQVAFDLNSAIQTGLAAGEAPRALAKRLAKLSGEAAAAVYKKIVAATA